MKKSMILAGAALLALVACNKSETVVKENPGEISFKLISSNITKTGELDGTQLKEGWGMYVMATQKDKDGNIVYGDFLHDQLYQPESFPTTATSEWHAGAMEGAPVTFVKHPVYWPIGGAKIDFLAYAMPQAKYTDQDVAGEWARTFASTDDIAKSLTVSSVDTYANQVDFLYAAANDQTNQLNGISPNYVHLTFKHAQALLIFNAKKGTNSGDELKINKIHFLTKERVAELVADAKPAGQGHVDAGALALADVTLKTIGTFTVDNSRIDLDASWSDLAASADPDHSFMPTAVAAAVSPLNTTVLGQTSPANAQKIAYGTALTDPTNYSQLGESLLIPEQTKVNFTIEYQIAGGRTYYYTYNDLRGNWEAGKVYIYNLNLSSNEIIITEEVTPFVDATGYPEDINLL